MAEVLRSGHVVTDEDVDTARLIMELDQALGRPTDALTQRVAETPTDRVRSLLTSPGGGVAPRVHAEVNGHAVETADELVRTLTSAENAAELAREVGEQLPDDLDPDEQARLVARIEEVIRRRMTALVAEADPGH